MNFINHILPALSHLGIWGYWLVLLVSFAESVVLVGEVIPGSTLLIFIGFLSAQGVLDIGDLIWFAAIGAVLGDSLSYYLGTKGTNFFRNENKFLKTTHLERGQRFFKKHGDKSIFLGRFIGFLRPIVPFIAGLSEMSPKRFLFWNIVSAFSWAASHLLLGYFFGSAFTVIETWGTRVSYGIGLLILFLLALYGIKVFVIRHGHRIGTFVRSVYASIRAAIISNPDVQNLVRRHPRIFVFLGQRLDRASFTGLSLTLITLGFLYVFFAFLGVVFAVTTAGSVAAADIRVENLLEYFRSPAVTKIFLWITVLGIWQTVVFIALIASAIFWLWQRKNYILYLWLALGVDGLFSFLAKIAVHRPRPENAVYLEHSYSFPSGHAMVSVVLYGFLAYTLLRFQGWRRKVNVFFSCLVVILAIGFSRLYLGVHYLSDVWAGYLLGLLVLTVTITMYEWRRSKKGESAGTPRSASRWVRIATFVLLASGVLGYAIIADQYRPQIITQAHVPTVYISGDSAAYFKDYSIPTYSETLFGAPQEPLGFIFLAKNDSVLTQDFEKASWVPADEVGITSLSRAAWAAITNGEYLHAPMTPTFWNADVNDFGFEQQIVAHPPKGRHAVRIWKTNLNQNGFTVYVGTASLDQDKWFLMHDRNPHIDSEREFVKNSLVSAGVVTSVQKVQFVNPTTGAQLVHGPFFTDGKLYILHLR
ncbi:MAG: LssY C-terminal domain-containing protein [Minisyncoccota bacterium]